LIEPLDEYLQAALVPPPDTISYAVWLYYRFSLSHRDIEDLPKLNVHQGLASLLRAGPPV